MNDNRQQEPEEVGPTCLNQHQPQPDTPYKAQEPLLSRVAKIETTLEVLGKFLEATHERLNRIEQTLGL
jgi:hypothetical protein